MKSKKGTIGSTMTWVVALVIIVFILAIYLIALGFLVKIKGVPSEDIETASPISYDLTRFELARSADSFLQMNVGDKKVKNLFYDIYDLYKSSQDSDKLKTYDEQLIKSARDFFDPMQRCYKFDEGEYVSSFVIYLDEGKYVPNSYPQDVGLTDKRIGGFASSAFLKTGLERLSIAYYLRSYNNKDLIIRPTIYLTNKGKYDKEVLKNIRGCSDE